MIVEGKIDVLCSSVRFLKSHHTDVSNAARLS
jgi:hypothetical protein